MVSAVFATATGFASDPEDERRAKQAQLDAICAEAREKKIKPLRDELIEKCVEKEKHPDRAKCERYYKNFGEQSATRGPMFYDLPECVRAHEHRTGYRKSDD